MNSDKEGLVQAWGGRSRQREQPPSQMRLPGLSPVGFTGQRGQGTEAGDMCSRKTSRISVHGQDGQLEALPPGWRGGGPESGGGSAREGGVELRAF